MWKASRSAPPSLLLGFLCRRSRLAATPSFPLALKFSADRPQPAFGAGVLSGTPASFACRLYSTTFPEAPSASGDGTAINSEHASNLLSQSEHEDSMDGADEGEVEWEEEEEVEPKIGDGGDGGGVILGDLPWGERALNIAKEVLLQFDDDVKLFSFKATHRGYIYMRLDKLSNKYGCPSMDEIEEFNNVYKKKLDEVGEQGHIPRDLAIEVSSPGAERLLKVPGDLERFKDLPMQVTYVGDDLKWRNQQQVGVFLLESVEADEGYCTWRLANVKENRDALGKGRLLSRKQKEWRLKLPFQHIRLVKLYLEC
ncbi:uncharacterized protein LOC116263972 [Nymphaea colorata]|nr:uncharacterized protein LOC116263972 [Nymphaea colorata]